MSSERDVLQEERRGGGGGEEGWEAEGLGGGAHPDERNWKPLKPRMKLTSWYLPGAREGGERTARMHRAKVAWAGRGGNDPGGGGGGEGARAGSGLAAISLRTRRSCR